MSEYPSIYDLWRKLFNLGKLFSMKRVSATTSAQSDIWSALGGVQPRVAILLELLNHPEGCRARTLSDHTGVGMPVVRSHLLALQDLGFVFNNADPDIPLQGQRPRYFVDRKRFFSELGILVCEDAHATKDEIRSVTTVEPT